MDSNISIIQNCTNCGACYNACPVNAISIQENVFYDVVVENEKCIQCGQCLEVCPVYNTQKAQKITKAFSAVHKDRDILLKSSSGGAFTALADSILENNGVVWAAAFNATFDKVIFQSTDNVNMDALRRSKYTESLVGNAFQQIAELLKANRQVLFCGTPCQVAGLKHFLKKDDGNLYTCDFTCGGVGSHMAYVQWLDSLKQKYGSQVCVVNFRPKTFGWMTHAVNVKFTNKKQYTQPAYLDPYFSSFVYAGVNKRECCCACKFSDNHYSDIILADFWKYTEFADYRKIPEGISLLLINSTKGVELFERSKKFLNYEELELSPATYNIKKTIMSDEKRKQRESFLYALRTSGLLFASKNYCLPKTRDAVVFQVKLYLKKVTGYSGWRRIKNK